MNSKLFADPLSAKLTRHGYRDRCDTFSLFPWVSDLSRKQMGWQKVTVKVFVMGRRGRFWSNLIDEKFLLRR